MENKIILEACCADIESVIAAKAGGADRIELCSALETGGVTPSIGLVKESVKIFGKGVMVLIRPRPGDFAYTGAEIDVMTDDIERCKEAGAGGVVIGALNPDGTVDKKACRKMIEAAKGMEIVFHRAFDRSIDPLATLETLIELGFERVLTSGMKPTAIEGTDILRQLQEASNGRIEILPGAGVTPANAKEILEKSGCHQIHASAKAIKPSSMTYHNRDLTKGTDTPGYACTSENIIKELRDLL